MTSWIRSGLAASVCAVLLTSRPGPLVAADAPTADARQTPDARAQAAFARGKLHYSLGEYAEAVSSFREAFELTQNAELLFNIAQAHRLAGDCNKALEVYRHFLYLSTDVELREQAREHSEALRTSCPPAGPAASGAVSSVPPPRSNVSLRRSGLALGAAGAVLGLTAGGMYLWASGRHDDWRAEDRTLRMGIPGTPGFDQRVRDNDALARSIERWDRATIAASITAGALVATGATLFLIGARRQSAVALRVSGVGLVAVGEF